MSNGEMKRTLLPVQMISVPVLPGTFTEDTAEGEFTQDSGELTFAEYPCIAGCSEADLWREDVLVVTPPVEFAFAEVTVQLDIFSQMDIFQNWANLWIEDTASAMTKRVLLDVANPSWDIYVGQLWTISLGVTVVASHTVIAGDGVPEIVDGLVSTWNASGDRAGITAFDQEEIIKLEGQSDGTSFTPILNEPDFFGSLWGMEPFHERVDSVAFKRLIQGSEGDITRNGKDCANSPSVAYAVIDKDIWNALFEGKSTVQVRVATRYYNVAGGLEICTPSLYTRIQLSYNYGIVAGTFVPGTGPVEMRWRSMVPVIKWDGKYGYVWGDDVVDPWTGQWCIKLHSGPDFHTLDTNTYTGLEVSRSLPESGQLPLPWQDRVPEGGVWSSMSLVERRPMIIKTEATGGCEQE